MCVYSQTPSPVCRAPSADTVLQPVDRRRRAEEPKVLADLTPSTEGEPTAACLHTVAT